MLTANVGICVDPATGVERVNHHLICARLTGGLLLVCVLVFKYRILNNDFCGAFFDEDNLLSNILCGIDDVQDEVSGFVVHWLQRKN